MTGHSIVRTLKSLGLGVLLIAMSAGVLLYSDLESRSSDAGAKSGSRPLRVALVQHASLPAVDDGMRGVIEALKARGYVDGDGLRMRQ